jgi:Type IX secretion system protein PorV
MRYLRTILLGVLATLVVAQPAWAVSQAGGIGLTFPVGARYNALGEAGTALATDLTAMWWNPGGFAFAADGGKDHGVHFMYSPLAAGLADDVFINWLGYGQQVEGWGMLGFSFTFLNQGEQVATDETGLEVGRFNSKQYSLDLSYGAKLSNRLGVGLGVKYFRDELAPDEFTKDESSGAGSSWALDLGIMYFVTDRISLGSSVTNVGPDVTFVDADQSDPMPKTWRLGAAYDAYYSSVASLTLVSDYLISLVTDDKTKVLGLGAELGYVDTLFLRFGYKKDTEGDIQDITGGAGVSLGRWMGRDLVFDYASVPQASGLDRVHRFSFIYNF